MFGYIVSPADQDVVRIDNFPFLQKSKSVSRKSMQCDKLTKLRVFIARYTSFMMSWGLLCDRIPKCHLALLIGLPRWVFSVVGLMPSTTAWSLKAVIRYLYGYEVEDLLLSNNQLHSFWVNVSFISKTGFSKSNYGSRHWDLPAHFFACGSSRWLLAGSHKDIGCKCAEFQKIQ